MLGTVTIIAPLMLLEPSDTTMPEESTYIIQTEQPETPVPEPTEPEPEPMEPEPMEPIPSEPESFGPAAGNEKPASREGSYMEGGDLLSDDTPEPVPAVPSEPEPIPEPEPAAPPEPAPEPVEPETPEPGPPQPAISEVNLITETLSNLSSIGMIIIPSFLIALGIFVYLKKRMS